MKNSFKFLILLNIIFISTIYIGHAQIVVDGDLADWGDSTKFKYDDQNKLWYNFKKDSDFLYIAIKKSQNAFKIFTGGVQIALSNQKIDSNAFQITFAHKIVNPKTNQIEYRTHDYFNISNYEGFKNQLLPKFNETGILAEWKLTDIKYVPQRDGFNISEVPANPNIFTAEVQIPLAYLHKNLGNTLHFGICLRSKDLDKKGMGEYLKKRFPPATTTYDIELEEREAFTEFFGTLDLTKL